MNKKTIKEKIAERAKEQARKNQKEFFEFLRGYNIIQLTVAVVVGNAAKDLVSSIATNLIMPFISLVSPEGNWRELSVDLGKATFKWGLVLSSLLDFVIVALIIFLIINKLFKIEIKKK